MVEDIKSIDFYENAFNDSVCPSLLPTLEQVKTLWWPHFLLAKSSNRISASSECISVL